MMLLCWWWWLFVPIAMIVCTIYFTTSWPFWPWNSTGFCTKPRCICVWNLVKIYESVLELCVIFHPDTHTNLLNANFGNDKHWDKSIEQGKSEGFDSCDRPSNLTQIGLKSSIFQPMWPWNLMDDLEELQGTSSTLHQALCIISNPLVNSNWSYCPETLN